MIQQGTPLKFTLIQLLLCTLWPLLGSATNYCDPLLCGSSKHIACNHNGVFDSSCPRNAKFVYLSSTLKTQILKAHNEVRNRVAGGNQRYFRKACRMALMQWDDELAQLAKLNVIQCRLNHDECRHTDKFNWAGQNLVWMGYYNPLNVSQQLDIGIKVWYREVFNTTMKHIQSYPDNYMGPTIGHFTMMVANRSTHLGCAAITYKEPDLPYEFFLLACNYAITNIINEPIYKGCITAGVKCSKGKDKVYKNLCTKNEPIDPNGL